MLMPGGGGSGSALGSNVAQVNVTPISGGAKRASMQGQGHPYATGAGGAGLGGVSEYGPSSGGGDNDAYTAGQAVGGVNGFSRTTGVGGAGAAPPELTPVRAVGGEVGAGGGGTFVRDGGDQYEQELPRPSLIVRILTCNCT